MKRIVWLALLGMLCLIGIIIVQVALLSAHIFPPPTMTDLLFPHHLFYMILSQACVALPIAFWISRWSGYPIYPIFANVKLWDFAIAIAGWFLVMGIAGLIVKWLHIEVRQFEQFKQSNLQSEPALVYITIAGLAPFYEEIIFRGTILSILVRKTDFIGPARMIFATILCGLIFAFVHMDKDAMIPIFMLGMYLSVLTLWKKSLHLSIFIHILQNFVGAYSLINGIQN